MRLETKMNNLVGQEPEVQLGLTVSSKTYACASQYLAMGFSVVPVIHGSKRPAIEWKEFQTRLPTCKELAEWFQDDHSYGFGLVCGHVSGNLVCLDFDSNAAYRHFASFQHHQGLLETAPIANTSRGKHVFFRSPKQIPSTALYMEGFDGRAGDIIAEGKFVVIPPTQHPDGFNRTWQREFGPLIPKMWPDYLALASPTKNEVNLKEFVGRNIPEERTMKC